MKRIRLAVGMTCLLLSCTAFAQSIHHQTIEDSVIGWMKIYNFKGAKAGMSVDHRVYSVNQLSLSDSFGNWIQTSYMPKGALGDIKKSLSEKLGPYNQHTAGKPQSYGAYAKAYVFLKYNSSHKMVPENNLGPSWSISANEIPGDWPVRDICTAAQYYFIMPTAETEEKDDRIKKELDLTKIESIKPYISFWVANMGFGSGRENVLLSKNNVLPFRKITRGEYLKALENAIPVFYEKEKKRIYEANQGIQKMVDFAMKELDGKIEHFQAGLKANREKYKNRLNEMALTDNQPSLMHLDGGRDAFGGSYLSDPESPHALYPVYTIDPATTELCKKDRPQWILVSWDYYPDGIGEKHLHESIISNFNFAYVYNFFFDSEKVKGQPYKPLHPPLNKEPVALIESSGASKKYAADKNIYFFEDFSTTAPDKKPAGWQTHYGIGGGVVKKLEDLDGNWVVMLGNELKATQLKNPLPQNFTMSYEIVVPQNFTWGAKALTLQLAKEASPGNVESFLKVSMRPGFEGRDGEATIETKFPSPPGYSDGTKWMKAPGFSNNKKNNRITVTVKKSEEKLLVFVDQTKIAEYEKAIPAAHSFNLLSFECGNNSGDNDKYYITNIKITKD